MGPHREMRNESSFMAKLRCVHLGAGITCRWERLGPVDANIFEHKGPRMIGCTHLVFEFW
jgi:hypothetical protein